jgi:P27 family predicted phage terminase small subunit
MKGRTPTPTTLKILAGNPGNRPLPEGEPQPPADIYPQPPDWISEEGRAMWDSRISVFAPLRLVTRADRDTFARWCELMVAYLKEKTFVQRNGTTYPVYENVATLDANGRPLLNDAGLVVLQKQLKAVKKFPQVEIMHRLLRELRSIEADFGMTPASRTRINVLGDGQSHGNKLRDKFKYYQRRRTAGGTGGGGSTGGEET